MDMDDDEAHSSMLEEEEQECDEPTPMDSTAPEGHQQPKSRLLITKLVMENFKSYGGVREIGPFHKCFSSIVGPNGSGKSNVIDAMLFVFGKRAKKLRLNKVSELIHRSETYPNLDAAKVSVHFVDIIDDQSSEDDYAEVPGTELVVTRTAYRNNTSKYQVDGKTATFTEVGALLRRRGIDLDNNRFLILQGEVEQIAMMKPKAEGPHDEGLLEYLEDIIGSNRHVEATEAAAKEVEERSEARAERLNRLKAAEKEKEALEGAKSEAEAFLQKERDLRKLRNVLYQICIAEAEGNAAEVAARREELARLQGVERARLAETEASLAEIEGTYEGMMAAYNAITAELARTKEEFAEYERKDIKYQEDLKYLRAQIKKLEAAAKRDAKAAAEAVARAEASEAALPDLEAARTRAEKRVAQADAALEAATAAARDETEELRSELEAKQAEAAPAAEAHAALQRQRETTACEAALVEDSVADARARLAATEAALRKLTDGDAAARAEIEEARSELEAGAARAAALAAEAAAHEAAEAAAAAAMARAVAAAEEARAAHEASAGVGGALKALLAAAAPGGPLAAAGIRGRLGALGAIDAEHDVAVSTACALLDHVVVDTSAGGAACVEYLRAHGAGRASFVILEQLGHLEAAMAADVAPPPRCRRLFDLVRPAHARYRAAFYLGLQDTLVAPDLDVATAVAYRGGRCVARVVTAAGQLIDRSGAMSGGGGAVRRGGMGSAAASEAAAAGAAVSAAEVERLAAAAAMAQAEVARVRTARGAARDEGRALAKRRAALEARLPRLALQTAATEDGAAQYRAQAAALREQCELAPEAAARLAALRAAIAKDDAALAKSAKALGKAEAAVAALQRAILEAGGEELKAATAEAERAAAALDAATTAIGAANVDAAAARRKGDKSAKDGAKKEAELEGVRERLKGVAAEFAALEEAAFAVMTAYETTREAADARKAELEKATAKYEECRARVAKIRGVEVDIAHQLEEYATTLSDNETKAKHWRAELAKLRRLHAAEHAEWGGGETDETDETDETETGTADQADDGGDGGAEESKGGDDAMDVDGCAAAGGDGGGVRRGGKGGGAGGVLEDLSAEALARRSKADVQFDIGALEAERDALRANVNMSALLEYRRKEGDYLARVRDLEAATDARNAARRRHEELRRRRLEEFMAGFGTITLKLKEMYQMITLGGDAELELVDSLDPFSEGIVFSVRPPKKSWKHIANLSGGEKTLSSLALVFALHHYRPTPLYVMDEIDAALDFKNVSIVANYIKERTKDAQFVIISLRNNMFELADRLVGIYKTNNITKSVTINPKQYAAMGAGAAAAAPRGAPLADRTNDSVPCN
ncbi:RecF/RecN/SMC [Tribonema minus]|uniref:Structural maintenance of chromosomes protein n=1 Tax=Tribonema minus TaxID=303371 RepID=A0A835YML7_9STRA|nr:RecF/RecN/SMC [Tribonema minus]